MQKCVDVFIFILMYGAKQNKNSTFNFFFLKKHEQYCPFFLHSLVQLFFDSFWVCTCSSMVFLFFASVTVESCMSPIFFIFSSMSIFCSSLRISVRSSRTVSSLWCCRARAAAHAEWIAVIQFSSSVWPDV